MALTADQATEFLDTYGIEVPEFLLAAVLELANSRNDCLELNYTPAVITLLQAQLLALFALSNGGRMVTSQRAVNGASRSFQYKSTAELWRGMGDTIARFDTFGCLTGLVPADPASANIAMFVGRAGPCFGDLQ